MHRRNLGHRVRRVSVFARNRGVSTAGQPAPSLYSIELNGQPVRAMPRLTSSPSRAFLFSVPALVNGATVVNVSADMAVVASRISTAAWSQARPCQTCAPGLKYAAAGNPAISVTAQPGTPFIVTVDQPTQSGATLNLDGLGPIAFQGTCARLCEIITSGTPANAFIVAFSSP